HIAAAAVGRREVVAGMTTEWDRPSTRPKEFDPEHPLRYMEATADCLWDSEWALLAFFPTDCGHIQVPQSIVGPNDQVHWRPRYGPYRSEPLSGLPSAWSKSGSWKVPDTSESETCSPSSVPPLRESWMIGGRNLKVRVHYRGDLPAATLTVGTEERFPYNVHDESLDYATP